MIVSVRRRRLICRPNRVVNVSIQLPPDTLSALLLSDADASSLASRRETVAFSNRNLPASRPTCTDGTRRMDPLRIGFIGCGRHATANLYPAIRLAGGQIVAVCARHLERAQATAAQFGVKRAYDRVADLVASDLDAVFVSTPEAEQASVVAEALDRKSTRLNSSHMSSSYAVFCLKKKK